MPGFVLEAEFHCECKQSVLPAALQILFRVELYICLGRGSVRENSMTLKHISILAQAFFISMIGVAVANCQETKIKFKDLPPVLQESAKAASKGAVVKGYAKE